MKSIETRRDETHDAIRAAVNNHEHGGVVKVYPIGERTDEGEAINPQARVRGFAAIVQDVAPDVAIELLTSRPATFTLYESGNQMPEQNALDDLDHEQAWSEPEPPKVEAEGTPKPARKRARSKKSTAKPKAETAAEPTAVQPQPESGSASEPPQGEQKAEGN